MAVGKSLQAVGQLLSGTYKIERKIAEGGMGVVYLASHTRLPRKFAIKLLARPTEGSDQKVALERFKREAQVASALKNPHVVQIYDYQISEAGFPFIVMELLDGEDLSRRIKKGGRMPPVEALRILAQIADALDAAHELGIIHRDLKPANVFLNTTPEPDFVKVLDFGVSKMLEWETITRTDMLVGTPLYMSPEQAGGGRDISTSSDLFALGAMAYELLTGGRPFTGQSIPAILYQVVHADPLPASRVLGPQVAAIDAVFAQALAKSPELRPRSAVELVRALRLALEPILPKEGRVAPSFPTETSSQNTVVRGEGERAPASWSGGIPSEETRQTPTPASTSRPGFGPSHASGYNPFGSSPEPPVGSLGGYGELALATPQSMPVVRRRLEPAQLVVVAAALVLLASAVTVTLRRSRSRDARATPANSTRIGDEPRDEPRGEEAPPRQVRIGVSTEPTGALVMLDDRRVEGGAVTLEWRSVPRRLRVSAPGYRTEERAVDATLDRELEVRLEREEDLTRGRDLSHTSSGDRATKVSSRVRPLTVRPVQGHAAPVRPAPIRPAAPPTTEHRPATRLIAPVQDL